MNHGVAVRAQRDQFVYRVNLIVCPERSQRPDMMNVDKSFPVLAPGFLKIESAALTDGTMISNTGLPGGRVAFVCINGNGFRRTFTVTAGNGQFLRVRTGREVGVPDGALFSQKTFFQPALKILNDRHVRRIRTGGLYHIEGVQVVSPEDVADMLNRLGVAGILSESGVVLPRFPQDDSALLVTLNVPGPEDDQLVIMINKRPALGPVTTGGAPALNKLFAVHSLLCFRSAPGTYFTWISPTSGLWRQIIDGSEQKKRMR